MAEKINLGWLKDYTGQKFAPKTLSTQILNTDGTSYKTAMDGTIAKINERIETLETTSNKTTTISADNTDDQYPTAKAVYDNLRVKVDKEDGKGLSSNDFTNEYKTKIDDLSNNYVTPEMFGAVGDGITDDTVSFQEALNTGKAVMAHNSYYVSSISIQNTNLHIFGTIIGQVRLNNNATVIGGTIQAYDDRPCVVVESVTTGKGEMNSILEKCDLKPTATGIGISAESNENPLFEFTIRDVNISSCDISIRLISNVWFTKSSFQNIFCHTPRVCIDYTNNTDNKTNLADLVFENVYAQFWEGKPEYFVNVSNGDVRSTFLNSFVYDGIEKHVFGLYGTTDETQFTLDGEIRCYQYGDQFSSTGTLSNFHILGRQQYYPSLLYHSSTERMIPPVFTYGASTSAAYSMPAINMGGKFLGLYSRLGTNHGDAACEKISGLSWYDGRLVGLRGTVDAMDDVQYYEAQTSYSGYVTTSDALPTSVHDGASVFCSDLKTPAIFFANQWWKPDGTWLLAPTEEQKAQARTNIGAASEEMVAQKSQVQIITWEDDD